MTTRTVVLALLLAGCAAAPAKPLRVWQTPLPAADLRGAPLTITTADAARCQREANDAADGSMPPPPGSGWYALGGLGAVGGAIGGALAGSQAKTPTAEEIAAHQERRYSRTLTECLRGRGYFL